jgi:hypothetical protein
MMADRNEYSRPTESGRKDQDAARGTVHGQPRSAFGGHYTTPGSDRDLSADDTPAKGPPVADSTRGL